MNHATFADLAALPVAAVADIFKAVFPGEPVPGKKSEACNRLETHAEMHDLSLDALKQSARPAKPAPAVIPDVLLDQINGLQAQLDTIAANNVTQAGLAPIISDLSRVGTMIKNLRTDATNDISALQTSMGTTQAELGSLANKVDALVDAVNSRPAVTIDQDEVSARVAQAVTDAFAPFKSAVVAAGAESAVMDAAASLANCTQVEVEATFGLKVTDAKGNALALTHWGRADAPAVDACFIWTPEVLRHLLLADASSSTLSNVWLGGEKGAGKSETARQFAARTGRAFTRINFQRFTTVEDFLGATGLNGGSTAFEPGAFLKAYTTPGSVILLDEITNGDPGVLNALNGFLEPGAEVNFGGRVWRKAPGVLILAADNTLGNGDQSGRYAGTRAQGAPLLNRFGQVVHMTFLPRAVEKDAVVKRTGCNGRLADYVLDAIAVARSKVQTGEIIDAPSIRNVMAFIEALKVLPVRDAWNCTIAASQPMESAVALQQVFESCISEPVIHKNL